MFVLSIWVSRKSRSLAPRLCVMSLIAIIVRSAEHLNRLGTQRWQLLATQNYFDKRGVFVSIMLCGPLLLDSFVMLISFVLEASNLLVQVKQAELRSKRRGSKSKTKAVDSKLTKKD